MRLTRQNRRILVIIVFVIGIVFSASFTEDFNRNVKLSLFILNLVSITILFTVTNFLAFKNKKKLDERELLLRLKAADMAYAFIYGYIGIQLVLDSITFNPISIKLMMEVEIPKAIQWFLLMLILPTVVIAWLEPDPIPENTTTGGTS